MSKKITDITMKLLSVILLIFIAASLTTGNTPLKNDIESYLRLQLVSYEKIEFEIISVPKTQANEKINIDTDRQLKLAGSMAYVPVKLIEHGGRSSQSLVSLKVKLFKKVLTSLRAIRPGMELKDADFTEKLADVAQLRGEAVSDYLLLSGTKAKYGMREGDMLVKEVLQPIPVIKNGEKVSAMYVSGNVVITLDGTARQDGCKGDIIRIITSDKKLFRAKVIDSNSVKIVE